VEDADEAVGEAMQGVPLWLRPGARCRSWQARAPGEVLRAVKCLGVECADERALCTNRAATAFRVPDARVMGLVAG